MDDVICPPLSISSIVESLWLAGCLAKSTVIGWRKYYGGGGLGVDKHLCEALQTGGFDLMLFQYWPTANGAGPTLKQHRVKYSSLQGELSAFGYTRAVFVWLEPREIAMCLCGDNHCHVYTSTEGRTLSSPRHFKMRNNLCRLLFSTKQMLPWHTYFL